MSRPVVIFPDPILATLEALRATLPGLPGGTDAQFGTLLPDDHELDEIALPYVMVRSLAGGASRPYVDRTALLRVTIWHESAAKGFALAELIRAALLSYEGDSKVRNFSIVVEPFNDEFTEDPREKSARVEISSLTVSARLRPIQL